MTFDFFVSYKWRSYSYEAESVTRLLQKCGYSVFLDKDRLAIEPGQRIDERLLKSVLEWAVHNSAWMIFFETFAQLEIAIEMVKAITVNGPTIEIPRSSVAFNWQEFERTYANRLVYVYPSRMYVEFPDNGERIQFDSMDDVVAIVRNRHPTPIGK